MTETVTEMVELVGELREHKVWRKLVDNSKKVRTYPEKSGKETLKRITHKSYGTKAELGQVIIGKDNENKNGELW